MNRYICIHGHFYQPPRENPWLECVELQDSAHPYHDWNERITSECYAPNGRSRIMNDEGNLAELVNNYARISFNFGPTLLAWLESNAPDVYASILAGDRESQARYSGHGSAIAQAYNHMILPLASPRDQHTQVAWGIADFRHRFGRLPEGMWLAETAADVASLEVLAAQGIRYTILAPNQVKRVRRIRTRNWVDVSGGRVDPSMPYLVRLPSGATITVFVYDGPISRSLAFEGLLNDGNAFAGRLSGAFRDDRQHPQIVHIATDGETYGHHRQHAEMALSFAMREIEQQGLARLTNYGEYLALHPPQFELEIFDNSSWSCVHGVERWRSDCGCNSGMKPGWHQGWRAPLRDALDWLRDRLVPIFDTEGLRLFIDPWVARDRYIDVVLDRRPATVSRFLTAHGRHRLSRAEEVRALQLLEMQRHAMLMYTSCGWFFDELSGIETVQVMQYAARALQVAEQLTGDPLEADFLDRLAAAKGNLNDPGDGRAIFLRYVKPAMVDLPHVAAHYAISSLFEGYGPETRVYSHRVRQEDHVVQVGGRRRIAIGQIEVESEITREIERFSYGVLHLGDHNISGGVRPYLGADAYRSMRAEMSELFEREDVPDLIRALDRQFGDGAYSLRKLFRDEQHKIVRILLSSALEEASAMYRSFFREYGPWARFLTDVGIPVPNRFRVAIDFALHHDLEIALAQPEVTLASVQPLLDQIRASGAAVDGVTLEYVFREVVERRAEAWREAPASEAAIAGMHRVLDIRDALPFPMNLWTVENLAYAVVHSAAGPLPPAALEIARRLAVAIP